MGIIEVTQKGDFKNTQSFLDRMQNTRFYDSLEFYGQEGVAALELATPRRDGSTAASWYYIIKKTDRGAMISWHNYDVASNGVPIVLLLQYGHGTGTGGYVQGLDFINPAMQKVFDDATNEVWKAVQS